MTAKQTGFDKWAATKMKRPSFSKSYEAARKRVAAVDGLVRALDQIREESGVSKAELARTIDAKPEIIRRLFTKEGANPTLQTVVEIATALGLELRLVPITKTGKKSARAPRPRASDQRAVA